MELMNLYPQGNTLLNKASPHDISYWKENYKCTFSLYTIISQIRHKWIMNKLGPGYSTVAVLPNMKANKSYRLN